MANKKKIGPVPSYNDEAERAVIGAMLRFPNAYVDVLGSLTSDDIYPLNRANKLVFEAIEKLAQDRIPIDIKTATDELIKMKAIEEVGGPEFLLELRDSSLGLANLEAHIKIVKDHSSLRNFISALQEVEKEFYEEKIDNISDFIGMGEEKIKNASKTRRIEDFIGAKELAERVSQSVETVRVASEDNVTGITTGYTRLNYLTHGFQKGELIIVAARPSVGKTALSLNMAYRASRNANVPVAFFSLEMNADLLAQRLAAAQSTVPLNAIQTGKLNDKQKAQLASGLKELSSTQLFVDFTASSSLMDIVAKSRKLYAEHPDLGLIVIDYLGKITTNQKWESRQLEVQHITGAIKDLARELQVPILLVSQLSRKVDERPNKRPMLSDLRESGMIEQEADVVMFIYRESYYKNQGVTSEKKKYNQMNEDERRSLAQEVNKREQDKELTFAEGVVPVEVNIAKNRNGQTGIAPLLFYMPYGRFDNPSHEYEEQMMRNINAEDE